ncbi:MAG: AraC family transcriptional regulator [Pseudomonadota bacterium]
MAYSCGFSSQSHMATTFAHHIGVTPGRYRRDLKI